MAFGDALAYTGLSYDDAEFRRFIEGCTRGRPGVVGPGDLLVTQQTSASTTVKAAAGGAFIIANGAGLGGMFFVANDASLNSPTFTATSTNGRKDRLILRVTAGVPALEIVQGTASATPAEPSITGSNYGELALITLPASTTNITTAMITDRRMFAGGDFPYIVTSTSGVTPYLGQHAYESSTTRMMASVDGATWVRGPWWSATGRSEFHATRTSVQLVANNTVSAVFMTAGSNPDTWTTPDGGLSWVVPSGLGGLWSIDIHSEWSGVQLGTRAYMDLRFGASGSLKLRRAVFTTDDKASLHTIQPLSAGHLVKIEAFQNTGAGQNISAAEINAYRVGP